MPGRGSKAVIERGKKEEEEEEVVRTLNEKLWTDAAPQVLASTKKGRTKEVERAKRREEVEKEKGKKTTRVTCSVRLRCFKRFSQLLMILLPSRFLLLPLERRQLRDEVVDLVENARLSPPPLHPTLPASPLSRFSPPY